MQGQKCIAMQGRVTYIREISSFELQRNALQYKAVLHTSVEYVHLTCICMHSNCKEMDCNVRTCCILPWKKGIHMHTSCKETALKCKVVLHTSVEEVHSNCKQLHCNTRPCYILPWNKCIHMHSNANKCIAMQGRVTYCRQISASTCIRIAKTSIAMQGRATYFREISAFELQINALQYKAVLDTSVQ